MHSLLVKVSPSSSRQEIFFFLLLWLALAKKYAVFQSPSLMSLSLDLCLALISSIIQIYSIFMLISFLLSPSIRVGGCCSANRSSLSISGRILVLYLFMSTSMFLVHPFIFSLNILILNCYIAARSDSEHSLF
jgi:hypothetical protein